MLKRVAGTVMIAVTLCTLGFWEFWGRENLSYDSMLVFKVPVSQSTMITADMLEIKKVERLPKGALDENGVSIIAGQEAIQYIPAGAGLYPEYFKESAFVTGEESGKSILAIPDHWLEVIPQTIRRGDKAFIYCGGILVADVVVAFAKDSGNLEVKSIDKDRLQGSAAVSFLEVIAEEEQIKKISGMAADGKKFIITYY